MMSSILETLIGAGVAARNWAETGLRKLQPSGLLLRHFCKGMHPQNITYNIFQKFASVRDGNRPWYCPSCAGPVIALLSQASSPMPWAEGVLAWWRAFPVSSFGKYTGGTWYSCFHPAMTHSDLKHYDSWRSFSSVIHSGPLFTTARNLVISRWLDLAKKN